MGFAGNFYAGSGGSCSHAMCANVVVTTTTAMTAEVRAGAAATEDPTQAVAANVVTAQKRHRSR